MISYIFDKLFDIGLKIASFLLEKREKK